MSFRRYAKQRKPLKTSQIQLGPQFLENSEAAEQLLIVLNKAIGCLTKQGMDKEAYIYCKGNLQY